MNMLELGLRTVYDQADQILGTEVMNIEAARNLLTIRELAESAMPLLTETLHNCEGVFDNFEAALKAAYMKGVHVGYIGSDPTATWPDDLAEMRRTGINTDTS